MYKSALVFTPFRAEDKTYNQSWFDLILEIRSLSSTLGKRCELLLQHDLKNDRMAVVVEVGSKTFCGLGNTFPLAISNIVRDIRAHRKTHEKLRATEKQTAGEESSQGRRGRNTSRKRVEQLR